LAFHERMTPESSSTAFGKYSLIAELGHGGMADVFLAVQQGQAGFNKLVVIKRLRETFADDPEFVAMLLDEARLAARLNHPNVVQTNEVGQVGRHHFIAMEYLEGQPLHRINHRAAKKGGMPLVVQARILADVLAGLHHAHELQDFDGTPLGVVHRDVTPHNIFLTYSGQVKVVDFGIAKAVGRSAETRTGVVKGKVTYMAPEQATGGAVDRRADLFSVGVMLWEAATGQRMWQNVQDLVVVSRLVNGDVPTSPKAIKAEVPEAIDVICKKALAPNPDDRYATAADFQEALEKYIRESGEHVGQRDLGALVTDLFKERRDEMKSIVEKQLADLKNKPSVSLATLEPNSVSNPTLRSLSINVDSPKIEGISAAKTSADPVVASSRPPPKRSSAQVGVGIALLALAGVGAYVALTRSPEPAPAAAEATEVRLQLRALPASAKITLDGERELENPFVGNVPKDGKEHVLVVSAEGYKTKEHKVLFDSDVVLDLSLEAEPQADTPPPEPSASAEAEPESTSKPSTRPRYVPRPRTPPPETAEPKAPTPPPPPSGKPKRQLDEGEMWPDKK
jgi:serine/threonine-protein kinase